MSLGCKFEFAVRSNHTLVLGWGGVLTHALVTDKVDPSRLLTTSHESPAIDHIPAESHNEQGMPKRARR